MGQSLTQLYVHLIFGTRLRQPFITEEIEGRLHSYLAGILKKFESPAIEINSMPDHVHALFRFSKNNALAKVVGIVKKESSVWMKEVEGGNLMFAWQKGYAAFSVSSSKVEVVKNYIIRQKEHHRHKAFKEEVEEFIRRYDILDYDERFFWD